MIDIDLRSTAVSYAYVRPHICIIIMLEIPIERIIIYHFGFIVDDEHIVLIFGRRLTSLNSAGNRLLFLSGLFGTVADVRRGDLGYRRSTKRT